MSDFNSFEHTVEEKAEGSRMMTKLLGRLGLLAIVFGYVIVTFIIKMPMLAIIAMVMLPVILAFWKRFNCELKYSIESATMSFFRIYHGSKKPKKMLEVMVKDFHEVAPRTAESDAKIKADGYTKVYMFAPHSTSTDQYYATFEQNGQKCVVYFQAVEKSLKLLKYYNSKTIVTVVAH